jgi:alkanesulfonate monooxygenase SsuD/methylene tetrahydromethanopterin reductase-like flavin-dependent oxidoreductase (luciferase family)
VKFGNFLFPDSRDPERDGVVIDETLREAWLSDELRVDTIWLAEHHFDGICAYADPIGFAGALATSTRNAKIGFAVLQMALHHPIPAGRAIGGARQHHPGAAGCRARPRLLLQHL